MPQGPFWAESVGYPHASPMASDRMTLNVSERTEFGSRTTRRLRRQGMVPGVVYSGGDAARAFSVNEREARVALSQGGALLDLEIDGGKAEPVVVKEQQRHPVRGELLHLDLQVVRLDQAIQADVAIELLGADEAPGVTLGGVLEHITHQITISALPTDIPESIAADVSGMEIGDTLQLDSLTPPEGVEFVLGEGIEAEEVTIATLNPPRVEEEPEPEVEEEAELVGEGEAGEPAEGEADDGAGEAAEGGGDQDSSGEE
jgi:large subunit ribosomal protein L25